VQCGVIYEMLSHHEQKALSKGKYEESRGTWERGAYIVFGNSLELTNRLD